MIYSKMLILSLFFKMRKLNAESQALSPGVPKPLTYILPILLYLSQDKKLANNSLKTDTGISKKDKAALFSFFLINFQFPK